jgi:hypothetical protein
MLRPRIALAASALLLAAAPFATAPSHASTVTCSPTIADVCATYVFACQRLDYHQVYLALCHLTHDPSPAPLGR